MIFIHIDSIKTINWMVQKPVKVTVSFVECNVFLYY
jgi:hypothetical protein